MPESTIDIVCTLQIWVFNPFEVVRLQEPISSVSPVFRTVQVGTESPTDEEINTSQEWRKRMDRYFLRRPFLFFVRRGVVPNFFASRLYRYLAPQYITVGDSKMYLGDSNWLPLWASGMYEPWTSDILKRELKQGGVFVDAGANIGFFTVMASKLVGETGRVYAFEPNPFSFEILRRNVETNGLHNTTIEQKAVGDFSGRTELWSNKGNAYVWKEGTRVGFSTDCVRLDDYFRGQHINLMKMDIDGGETKALKGASRILSEDLEKLIIEFWPTGFRKQNIDPNEFVSALARGGFSSYVSSFSDTFDQNGLRKFLEGYTAARHAYYDSLNLFCTKS